MYTNMAEIGPYRESSNWLSPSAWVPRFPPQFWLKTSYQALERAEKHILGDIWDKMTHKFVPIDGGTKVINTVILNKESKRTPLVLLHGMGAGVGLWVLNYEALAKNRPVYAIDILVAKVGPQLHLDDIYNKDIAPIGFGRSSRPKFCPGAEETEQQFVQSIEDWRTQMNLDKFVLVGHSLGGYLASAYALKHPDSIRHLVLVDSWGFTEQPKTDSGRVQIPWYVKGIATLISPFNPLAGLRILGPWGPNMVQRLRPDLVGKFEHLYTDNTIGQYIYHCNAQPPSGEVGFKHISKSFGWAANPMINRIESMAPHVPVTMIYGSRSWMDSGMGYQVKYLRHNSYVDVQVIKGAGHHVYADQAAQFNSTINKVCLLVDQQFDMRTQSPVGAYRRLRRASEEQATGSLRRMRRASESVLSRSLPSRRRAQSECPPDSLEGSEFLLRQNQSFAGIQHDQLLEECEDTVNNISTIEEAETQSLPDTDTSAQSPVIFHLDSGEEDAKVLSEPER